MKWLSLGLLAISLCQAAEPPSLEDFAHAADIRLQGDGAIYRLDLPQAVYRGLTRADLGDLRVFNAAGHPLPHSLTLAPDEQTRAISQTDLALFPLFGEAEAAGELLLRIKQGDAQHSLQLRQTRSQAGKQLNGYILDARQLDAPVRRFSFQWATQADFLLRVDLQAGDDLEHWRPVARGAVLAKLRHLGQELRRDRIEVDPVKARYFRLRFSDPQQTVVLNGVRARGSHASRITHYQTTQLPVERGPETGEYRFQLPTAARVEWLDLALPEVNTLAAARLESRPATDQAWVRRGNVTLYRLRQQGVELENDALSLGRVPDRYWRLFVDQSSGGIGPGLPVLTLRQRPHELRFVARGEGPFTLAWGSARVLPAIQADTHAMLNATGLAPRPAELVLPPRRINDDRVLQAALNWRQLLLWGVLLLGAGLMIWMAWRQFRDMNQ